MLMLGAETIFVINPSLYSRLPYAVKDFAPITGLVRANQALLAHAGFAPKSVGELIALAKEKPGTISYGTSGVGSAGHVNVALLESMAGVKLLPVHYRGMAPALNDVVAGHIQLTSVAVSSALQPWRNGLVKMLGIGSAQAAAGHPGGADGGGERPAGLRSDHLVRAVHHRGNAARGRAQDQCRSAAPVQRGGVPQALRRAAAVRGDDDRRRSSSTTSSPPKRTKWAKVIRDANLKVD